MEMLLNLISPEKCAFCSNKSRSFCMDCLQKCKTLETNYFYMDFDKKDFRPEFLIFESISRSSSKALEIFSCFEYEGVVKSCIKISKYSNHQFSTLKIFAQYACLYASNLGVVYKDYKCLPIPLSPKKHKMRGFNHMDLVAGIFSKIFKCSCRTDILKRPKDTIVQYEIGREARFQNVQDAFFSDRRFVEGRKFVLIDDICTSGATMLEAAKCLYENGAIEVKGFALSKALSDFKA